ncbi:Transcriptional regulator [Neptuniibacter caesariensis]|uniref:Transcriptional regulator n=2 Tax=Neptuniibacter caesariensis TaxID=207954 RepID=A0A7U8C5R8_NEPCE|nr:Transcriptional regulator [Neptuniibacter caesariensis]
MVLIQMDRLLALKSFVEVACTSSFTQAAENLKVSRLQVSRHVKEVESWLGQRLLHRTTRKVTLTEAGSEALVYCERILDEAAAMESLAQIRQNTLAGSIRIATPIGLSQNLLIEAVQGFITEHPNIKIEILASDSFAQLVDERIDIALRYTAQPADNLIARELMTIDSVICASPAYLEKNSAPKAPEDLSQHQCLVHLNYDDWEFDDGEENRSIKVNGQISANELGTLVNAACAGQGLIRIPCDLANPLISDGKLVRVLSNYNLPENSLWAVYMSRSYQLPAVRQFIDYLLTQWQDIRAI